MRKKKKGEEPEIKKKSVLSNCVLVEFFLEKNDGIRNKKTFIQKTINFVQPIAQIHCVFFFTGH